MSTFDCHKDMEAFHAECVTLSSDDQTVMRKRRDAGRVRLKTGLEADGHAQPRETGSQGSYAMRTMTQDPEQDYDIDDGAYFKSSDLIDTNKVPLTPRAARERVRTALKQDNRLKHPAESKTNCVRQRYPEGYHIDIPVYRISISKDADGKDVDTFEHASGDVWIKSDARAVTRWFNNLVGTLNTGESDGSQMRRIIKLTKKQARSRMDWKQKTTSGICMTKLIVDHFVANPTREDECLLLTWRAVAAKLNSSLRIQHPIPGIKDLASNFDPKVAFFRDRLNDALTTLAVLEDPKCTQVKARRAWGEVFNTSFFGERPTDDESDGSAGRVAPFEVLSSSSVRRDDGERRFG